MVTAMTAVFLAGQVTAKAVEIHWRHAMPGSCGDGCAADDRILENFHQQFRRQEGHIRYKIFNHLFTLGNAADGIDVNRRIADNDLGLGPSVCLTTIKKTLFSRGGLQTGNMVDRLVIGKHPFTIRIRHRYVGAIHARL